MPQGLTSAQAKEKLEAFGPNRIAEKKQNVFLKVLRWLISPIALMLIAAAVLSYAVGRIPDFYFILALIVINLGISFWHEHKADKAIEALRSRLSVSARVLRDGQWKSVSSEELVPGDVVECSVGDLIPADATILEAKNLSINESVLTGESLPKEKANGETAYSGSVVAAGVMRAEVTKTGNRTYFGSIVGGTAQAPRRSALERDILSISRFLMIVSLTAVALLTAVLLFEHKGVIDILLLDLSLLIAGLPVSLPTVMTLIISTGALALAGKNALMRRLASLEDFANVNLLLTDKTGTLTESTIVVERTHTYGDWKEKDVIRLSATGASQNARDLINSAIIAKAKDLGEAAAVPLSFTPADSTRKRTTALFSEAGERVLVSVGTPPILKTLIAFSSKDEEMAFDADVAQAARDGSRVLAVAVKKQASGEDDEKGMALAGLVVLSDPLRPDAPEVLQFLESEGIEAKMLTGDATATAARIAQILGIKGETRNCRGAAGELDYATIEKTGAFAEVLPEDKLAVVKAARGEGRIVAVTGDGVNDLPAIRAADVGIAVANAVDALKGTADIVLLSHGIGVIKDALVEARKIFARLQSYTVYRISESFRLILTVLVLGFLYADFPLTPVQLLLLALLNDIPIISLALNRVKRSSRPADLHSRERFVFGMLFGLVGVANSLLMFFLLVDYLHEPWAAVQTAFFLKLTVSGHMLIYVAHTRERWWKFLPSGSVIAATTLTQAAATGFALLGIFIPQVHPLLVLFVWVWSFFWMQVSELAKWLGKRMMRARGMVQ